MLSREAVSGMFAKRKAPGGEPTEAPGKKKKKKAAAAGSSRQAAEPVAEPVIGLEAPNVPTDRPEPVVEEGGEATESGSPPRDVAQPADAPSPGQAMSASSGRRPKMYTGSRPGEAGFRTAREGMVRIPQGGSAIGDPALARELLGMIIAPRDEEEFGSRTTEEVLMSSFAGLVLAAHNVFSLEKVHKNSQKLNRKLADRVAAAEAERDAARESARTAEDREKGLRDEVARLKADGARADRKLAEVQSALEATRTALGSSEAAAGTAQAESYIHQLEARSAREQAQQALKKAEEAKESATCAVETYKASAAHTADMVAASRLFYLTGFADCKKEIGGAFPDLDLSAVLEPVFVGEGQESEAETETESEGDTVEEAPAANPTELAPTETEVADPTAPIAAEPIAEAEPTPTAADLGLGTPESSTA